MCSRISAGIFARRSLAKSRSPQILTMEVYGLIHPHISYGIRLRWRGGGVLCGQYQILILDDIVKKRVRKSS